LKGWGSPASELIQTDGIEKKVVYAADKGGRRRDKGKTRTGEGRNKRREGVNGKSIGGNSGQARRLIEERRGKMWG